MRKLNLISEKFGRLKVLSAKSSLNGTRWLCVCECGIQKILRTSDLRYGSTRSCGCLRLETMRTNGLKHGHARNGKETRIHRIWHGMLDRCRNTKNKDYLNYGGRGISVCDRWKLFINFLEDMGEPPEGLSIDRTDNDGNYEPSNCKWATIVEQNNNRRKFKS